MPLPGGKLLDGPLDWPDQFKNSDTLFFRAMPYFTNPWIFMVAFWIPILGMKTHPNMKVGGWTVNVQDWRWNNTISNYSLQKTHGLEHLLKTWWFCNNSPSSLKTLENEQNCYFSTFSSTYFGLNMNYYYFFSRKHARSRATAEKFMVFNISSNNFKAFQYRQKQQTNSTFRHFDMF